MRTGTKSVRVKEFVEEWGEALRIPQGLKPEFVVCDVGAEAPIP